nr:reverse transcriptase domain-containing protein [Tanacetum cinerariifolium]
MWLIKDYHGESLSLESLRIAQNWPPRLLSEEPRQPLSMNPNQAKSSIEEPEYSFSIGTTLVTKLDEVADSSIKNLVPIPREYEVTSDNESESNEPVKDDSSVVTTFSNPLFNDSNDFTSNDDDVPIEESKVHSNRFKHDLPFKPRWGNDPGKLLATSDLLSRACPHHGFSELHQLDTFYNALNVNDQDSLNSAAGGNFLDKMPSDCLKIIESKSKVRQSRAKAVVAKVNSNSSTPAISSDVAEL